MVQIGIDLGLQVGIQAFKPSQGSVVVMGTGIDDIAGPMHVTEVGVVRVAIESELHYQHAGQLKLGPQGLRETANLCLQKSRYAAEELCQSDRFSLAFDQPTFKEFVVRDAENQVDQLLKGALDQGFLAGVPLGQWYPELADCFLVAVTEKRTKQEIDRLVQTLSAECRPEQVCAVPAR